MKLLLKNGLYVFYVILIAFSIKIISTEAAKKYNKCVAFMAKKTVGQSIPVGN